MRPTLCQLLVERPTRSLLFGPVIQGVCESAQIFELVHPDPRHGYLGSLFMLVVNSGEMSRLARCSLSSWLFWLRYHHLLPRVMFGCALNVLVALQSCYRGREARLLGPYHSLLFSRIHILKLCQSQEHLDGYVLRSIIRHRPPEASIVEDQTLVLDRLSFLRGMSIPLSLISAVLIRDSSLREATLISRGLQHRRSRRTSSMSFPGQIITSTTSTHP
ncbi:hypothetical protein DFS33DRAFT_727264 [Desarmillaria ectypa]|nr:hypothetical protein DFS33DRAFT_727264 [Desarmillaria ectypa]